MATLFNTKISETYEGLIKTSDNGVIGAVEKNLTDGLGNASTFSIGTSTASFTGTLDLTNATVLGLPSDAVASVNGKTGVVVLTTTDINEGTNLYFTDARVEANSAVALNTAKVGITAQQATDITNNNAKISFDSASSTKLNGIETGAQVNTITSVNSLTGAVSLGLLELDDVGSDGTNGQVLTTNGSGSFSFTTVSAGGAVDSVNGATGVVVLDTDDIAEGTTNKYMVLGTTATTALAGNTSLLQLGTTSTTALAGNTTTITSQQATDITTNNAKVGITAQQATDITNNNAKISFTSTGTNNYLSKWNSNTLIDSIIFDNGTNVGIGTASPSAPLDVRRSDTSGIVAEFNNNVGYGINVNVESDGGNNTISSGNNQSLAFATNGGSNERMRIGITGNVGIGTTNPINKLDVIGNINVSGGDGSYLTFNNGDANIVINNNGASRDLSFKTYNGTALAEKMRIDKDGNVGIGTTTPSENLDVNGTVNLTNLKIATAQGTDGQVLTSTGSGVAWEDAGGGGATDLNGLSDVLVDGTSAYFLNIPSSLSGNPTDNLVIGDSAGNSLTTGNSNILLGKNSGNALTNGTATVMIGENAGLGHTTNSASVYIGFDAGKAMNASNAVCIGYRAIRNLQGAYSNHTVVGGQSCANTLFYNSHTAFGYRTLFTQSTGQRNTAIGYESLYTGSSFTDNTGLGYESGRDVTGNQNTVLGAYAANSGTNDLTSGSNNILIGYNASASAATVDNEITLGNSSISTLRCAVTSITSLSDERDKSNIKDLTYGLDFIDSLQPREFIWDNRAETKLQQVKDENGDDVLDENNDNVFEEVEFYSDNKGKKDFGFIAQEVQSIDDDTLRLVYDKNPEKLEISYGKLVPILVKAIQELKAEIETLKS